jgi:hypothetical protein
LPGAGAGGTMGVTKNRNKIFFWSSEKMFWVWIEEVHNTELDTVKWIFYGMGIPINFLEVNLFGCCNNCLLFQLAWRFN